MNYDRNVGGYLANAFKEGRAVHAYVVVGAKQNLSKLLTECAVVCMCPNRGDDGCDVCNKVVKGEHQDVIRMPQDTVKNRLTVNDVSYLVEESYKRPIDNSAARVFLVDASNSTVGIGAELWQNKLLKTLEEPTDGVYLFIGVTDAESLLPTIRSRCQILKQSKLSEKQVAQELASSGFDARSREIAAAMSGGSVQTGERLLRNANVFRAYDAAIAMAENMSSTKNALQYVSNVVALKDNVYDCLGFLTVLYRESIAYRLQPNLCLLPSLVDTIDKICANYTLQAAEACVEIINATKHTLDDNGNVAVAIDKMANRILEIKYRCRQ